MLKINSDGLIESSNKKLAIVGTASSSVNLAPYQDMSWDVWTLGWRQDMRRSDLKMDPHRFDAERVNVPPNYFEWLKNENVPIYFQDVHPDVPTSVRIPIEKLVNTFGDYFVCSISYMVAIGILSGYEEIGLWGIDLIDDTEYSYQRPNVEYLLGWAAGKGVKVHVPVTSCLLKFNHRYGYDKASDYGPLSEEFLQKRLIKYTNMHTEHSHHAIAADGAKQAIADIMSAVKSSKKGKVIND